MDEAKSRRLTKINTPQALYTNMISERGTYAKEPALYENVNVLKISPRLPYLTSKHSISNRSVSAA